MLSWLPSGLVKNAALGLVGGVLLLVLLVVAYAKGYSHASVKAEAKFSAYREQVALAQVEAARLYAEQVQEQAARADAAAVKLLAQQADIARLSKELQKRVSHVSTVYVERPGAAPAPLPLYPFTRGWVHDYNAALGVRVPGTAGDSGRLAPASGGVRPAGTADADPAPDLARSRVTQGDVLATHHANAQVCRDAVAQLNAILDLYEERRP